MRALRTGQFLSASALLACAIAACGNTDKPAAAGGGKGNGTAASGPNLGNIGGAASGGGTTGSGDPVDTCAGELIEAKRIPLDMYVMLDVSASMLDRTEGDAPRRKWEAVGAALADFVSDDESAGLGIGLQVFPIRHPEAPAECTSDEQCGAHGPCFLKICATGQAIRGCASSLDCPSFGQCIPFGVCELPDADGEEYICTPIGGDACVELGACQARPSFCELETDCRLATYATPAAPIGELPGASSGLLDVITAVAPWGNTPTGPALSGAIQHATLWAGQHPERQVVAVLATDGLPTSCDPVAIADVAQLAAQGYSATPSVSTFVIGVFGPADLAAPGNLNTIAEAGGTTEAFIVDTQGDVAAQFRDALNQIRGTRLACELGVPTADAGKTVDFNQVNVTFDNGSGPATLFYVEEWSGCDPTTGGWYYDTLPSDGDPERIIVCPTTCEQFGQADMGSVQIKLGCATRKPVK